MTTTTRTPVISQELAARIADLFTARGVSPYGVDYAAPYQGPAEKGGYSHLMGWAPQYTRHADIMELVAELPDRWERDVYDVLGQRTAAAYRAKLAAAVDSIDTTPAVRAYLRDRIDSRGFDTPQLEDLSSWAKSAQGHHTATGIAVAPYRPEPGCRAKLGLSRAVYFAYSQEAYADHAGYAVPVELAPDADLAVCRRNLAAFCAALRTATGFAGQGSTYSAELVVTDQGALVVFDVRSSIAD